MNTDRSMFVIYAGDYITVRGVSSLVLSKLTLCLGAENVEVDCTLPAAHITRQSFAV